MPSPTVIRNWKKKAVFVKREVTYATDPVLAGTDWFEARNVNLTPFEVESADRNIVLPWFGNGGKLITAKRQKLSFDVALAASGTLGTAPKIGTLLRAAGFAETITSGVKVEYTLVSSAFESLTFYINIDGVWHKGSGVRANGKVTMDAKGIPLLGMECTALYTAPTDGTSLAANYSGWPIEQPVNAANTPVCTVNGVNSFYSKFGFDLGNQVSHDIYAGGYEQIKIGDRQPKANITLLAPQLATFNPYTLAANTTNIWLQVVHGATAGNKVQVALKTLIVGVKEVDLDGNVGYDLALEPTPVTGNDEIKLTFL